jgi:hypothetical protein
MKVTLVQGRRLDIRQGDRVATAIDRDYRIAVVINGSDGRRQRA